MKKIYKIASKTGLNFKETNNLIGFSFSSFVALIFSLFSSCAKNTNNNEIIKNEEEKTIINQDNQKADVILDTTTVLDNKSCGPTPNYPCGTRYATVSLKDFINF